jgi:hypothetical protein
MAQMHESAAENLTSARAIELARVLDLQSLWENLRADGNRSTSQLKALQTAFEEYRVGMSAYTARNRNEPILELSPTRPGSLGAWCRTVRAVLRRAQGGACPSHVVAKAHRLANGIAAREIKIPVAQESATDIAGAIRQLDAVIAWCDRLDSKAVIANSLK